jgi:hypothetical protein
VVSEHGALAKTFGQMVRDPFGQASSIDEYERRAMCVDQLGESIVDLGPHLV